MDNMTIREARIGDAQEIADSGKIAVFLALEGGHAIEDDPGALAMFYERGVRYMTLTWWNNTNWADGSGDEPRWGGLNDLGKKIVKEMNRLGMIVDVSHVSEDTFWDVLKVTGQPVIASHSNAAAINNHHRNLTDKQLRAIAKNGGVVGVNFVSGFLDAEFFARREELKVMLKPRFDPGVLEAVKQQVLTGLKRQGGDARQVFLEPDEDTTGMVKIGEEITRKVDYTPGTLEIVEYVRPKYARPEAEQSYTAFHRFRDPV